MGRSQSARPQWLCGFTVGWATTCFDSYTYSTIRQWRSAGVRSNDLVFGLWSGLFIISRHAKVQVFTSSCYENVPPRNWHNVYRTSQQSRTIANMQIHLHYMQAYIYCICLGVSTHKTARHNRPLLRVCHPWLVDNNRCVTSIANKHWFQIRNVSCSWNMDTLSVKFTPLLPLLLLLLWCQRSHSLNDSSLPANSPSFGSTQRDSVVAVGDDNCGGPISIPYEIFNYSTIYVSSTVTTLCHRCTD